jgi:hypothetical protein
MRAAAAMYRSADKVNRASCRCRSFSDASIIQSDLDTRSQWMPDRVARSISRTDFAAVALPMFGAAVRAQVLACFDPQWAN